MMTAVLREDEQKVTPVALRGEYACQKPHGFTATGPKPRM